MNEKDFEGLDYSQMFKNISEIDLSKWDTSKALDLATIISNKKESVLKKCKIKYKDNGKTGL